MGKDKASLSSSAYNSDITRKVAKRKAEERDDADHPRSRSRTTQPASVGSNSCDDCGDAPAVDFLNSIGRAASSPQSSMDCGIPAPATAPLKTPIPTAAVAGLVQTAEKPPAASPQASLGISADILQEAPETWEIAPGRIRGPDSNSIGKFNQLPNQHPRFEANSAQA